MQRALVGSVIRTLLFGAVALFAVGCSSWPKPITVSMDKSLAQNPSGVPTVDVHLIGVRQGELKKYRTMSVTDYWSPGGPSRQPLAARKTLSLGPGATSRTVAAKDPVWKQWNPKVRQYVVVLADLRGVAPKGDEDPRRVVLPLDKKRWSGDAIKLTVTRDRIQIATPPKPRG
jgi:hypothetical protein